MNKIIKMNEALNPDSKNIIKEGKGNKQVKDMMYHYQDEMTEKLMDVVVDAAGGDFDDAVPYIDKVLDAFNKSYEKAITAVLRAMPWMMI